MTSFLTGALGDYLGDAVAAAVGIEHTAAEFSERAEAAFKRADADGSGTLDFGETVAACRAVPGLRRLSETRAREIFARFDEDDSGSLDVHEFRKLAALLRSVHALDQMPGVIYCGGKLMNPSQNPAVARAARLTELYSRPYEPKSALAKAVARRTVLRRVVYGGVDLANLDALTDDEEEAESRESRDDDKSRLMSSDGKTRSSRRPSRRSSRRSSRRTSRSRNETRELSWSVGALEAAYAALLLVRLICAVYGTAYVHPDESPDGGDRRERRPRRRRLAARLGIRRRRAGAERRGTRPRRRRRFPRLAVHRELRQERRARRARDARGRRRRM